MRLFFAAGDISSYVQLESGFFAWLATSGEGKVLAQMRPGDVLIVKFAKSPSWKQEFEEERRRYFTQQGLGEYETWEKRYRADVDEAQRVVPGTWEVTQPPKDERSHDPTQHPDEIFVRVGFRK